jgi:tetratricopeptide (TPR) repeat protein
MIEGGGQQCSPLFIWIFERIAARVDNSAANALSQFVTNPDLDAAAALSEAAIAQGRGDAYDHAIVALACSARGDYDAADAQFRKALALEPGNPSTLTSLAIHYRNQSRSRDALAACDEAIRNVPDYADAWLERAALLAAGGSNEAARASFAQAAELAPGYAAAHAGLAALAAREGNAALARGHAGTALSLDPANAVATNALASAELTLGNPEKACALLKPLLARLDQPTLERSLAHSLIGDALHRLSDHGTAFQHYSDANADFTAIHSTSAAGQLDNFSFVLALTEALAATEPSVWHETPGTQPHNAAKRHLFLIGYPRSGTTLVENILASLPGVSALEERPTMAAADREFIAGSPTEIIAGLARFSRLDAGGLEPYRQAYWDKVVMSGIPSNAPCFVDMDPLKGTRIPFISRLFPDARILVMRRDPRDVVWSCFRTNFAMSSGTLEYTSLERAARHYDALMQLTELALERLPINFHIVQYHRLVQDFDTETKAMCEFAGLEWTEAVRSFDRTAARRGVSTASAGQVNRGLYDGTRQWETYAEFLKPIIPILQPWIEKFGYDA